MESLAELHVGPDWEIDKDDVHCLALGRVLARLHTVEVLVRLTLHESHDQSVGGKPSVGLAAFHLLGVGSVVGIDENDHFESWATLKDLVRQFNEQFPAAALSQHLIELRDALAHGRVLPVRLNGASTLKLLKFKKPEDHVAMVKYGLAPRSVEVDFTALLTPAWFSAEEAFLDDQITRVRVVALEGRAQTKPQGG